MLKKAVGIITTSLVTLCVIGMAYPQNIDAKAETLTVVDPAGITAELVSTMDTTSNLAATTQEQGTEAIAKLADGEAIIQDSAVPLVANVVEASKRKTTLTNEELDLMLRVVSAESRGEPQEAQYNVACVILNRMESDRFPNSLEGVVRQSGQFSCVGSGAILRVPITDSVREAVMKALDDNTVDEDILWFRSDYYHPFNVRAYSIGRMYFSKG